MERVSVREGENGEYEVEVYRNGCPEADRPAGK